MPETVYNAGSDVKQFIGDFFDGLYDALDKRSLKTCPESESHTKLELYTIATGEKKAGAGVRILKVGASVEGSKSDAKSHKITVYVKKFTDADKIEEVARHLEAQVKVKKARWENIEQSR